MQSQSSKGYQCPVCGHINYPPAVRVRLYRCKNEKCKAVLNRDRLVPNMND